MAFLNYIIFSAFAIAYVFAAGTPSCPGNYNNHESRDITQPPSACSGIGYFYYWMNGRSLTTAANGTYTNGAGGQYTMIWPADDEYLGGRGWNPGTSSRTIRYSGVYRPNGPSHLSVYGWTRYPLIEYFVVESYASSNPASIAQQVGSVSCDGGTYDIYRATRVNAPSIDGTQTFLQFWSVRNPPKTPGTSISGSVAFSCHASAWANYGLRLGSAHNFQIVAVEGSFSSGSASITVS